MRVQGNSGYIDVGLYTFLYAHIYTDRAAFYFNKDAHFAGTTASEGGEITLGERYVVFNRLEHRQLSERDSSTPALTNQEMMSEHHPEHDPLELQRLAFAGLHR